MSPLHCPWHTANKMMLLSLLLYIYFSLFLPVLNFLFPNAVFSSPDGARYDSPGCKAHPAPADLVCKTYSQRGRGLRNCPFPPLSPPRTERWCQERRGLGSSREACGTRKPSPHPYGIPAGGKLLAPSRTPHTRQPQHSHPLSGRVSLVRYSQTLNWTHRWIFLCSSTMQDLLHSVSHHCSLEQQKSSPQLLRYSQPPPLGSP